MTASTGDLVVEKRLTLANGMPVADNFNIETAGPRGPALLQDVSRTTTSDADQALMKEIRGLFISGGRSCESVASRAEAACLSCHKNLDTKRRVRRNRHHEALLLLCHW
jgi:hypothetical protein